ncbi:insulinase family protein [Candidatus Dependentiae bacterium]|nr:insulinase family protein [Candidatus Dependentiae bacterium]
MKHIKLGLPIYFLLTVFTFSLLHSSPNSLQKNAAINSTQGLSHLDECLVRSSKKITKLVLDNGFTALLYQTQPENMSPEVVTMLTFAVGSKDEEHGQFGFAHAVEHMIFKGTEKMSELDLKAIAEKFCIGSIGIGYNANTSTDLTRYYFKTDEKNWPVFLGILADCMENVRFDEHHFASEVKAIVNELKMRSKDPSGLVHNILGEEFYPSNHPYHHPLGGFKEDLLQANAAQLKAFYKKHYTPEKGLLTVVGNVDVESFKKLVYLHFDSIPAASNIEDAPTFDMPDQQITQKKIVVSKHIPAPILFLTWKTLSNYQDRTSAHAQDFMQYVLQERLRPLRDEHNLVFGISAGGHVAQFGGNMYIYLRPKNEADRSWFDKTFNKKSIVKRCKQFITDQINDLMVNGPTEQELANFRHNSKTSLLDAFQYNVSIASMFASNYFIERNEYQVFDDIRVCDSLNKKTIQEFCKKFLKPSRMHTISFQPIAQNDEQEWEALHAMIDTADEKLINNKIRESQVDEEKNLVDQLPEPELIDFSLEKPDQHFILSNGLEVFIKNKPNTPFIAFSCSFKNNEQLSLYLDNNNQEHVRMLTMSQLLEGSKGFSKKDHIDFFEKLGASAFFGSGGASGSCLQEDLAVVGQRCMHILTQPTFPRASFNQAIAHEIESIKMNKKSEIYVASKTIGDYLFAQYPWRKSDDQMIALLEKTWRNELFTFHKNYVIPTGMFITLVGDIDKKTIKADLEKIFGSWKPSIRDNSYDFTIPEITNPAPQEIIKPMPKEMVVLMLARITNYADTDDDLILELIEQYLNKQLFAIREATGLFYSCQGSLSASGFLTKGAGRVVTLLSPQNVAPTEKLIRTMLQSIADNGIPEYDLNVAKQTKRMELAKSFATNQALNNAYNFIIRNNKDWNYFDNCLDRINAVTHEEVNAVVSNYLNPASWSTIKVGRLNNVDPQNISGN